MVNLIKIDCTELLSSHGTKYTNHAVIKQFDTVRSTEATVHIEKKIEIVVFITHAMEIELSPLSVSFELIVQGVYSL